MSDEEFEFQLRRVRVHIRTKTTSALDDAKKLTEQYPSESNAWRALAYAHEVEKNYTGAIQALTRGIQCDPEQALVHFDRGQTNFYMSNWDDAVADFSRALVLCDKQSIDFFRQELHFMRAEALIQLGKLADALLDLAHLPEDYEFITTDWRTKAELLALCAAAITPENDGRYNGPPIEPEDSEDKWQLPDEPSEAETALAAKLGPEGLAKADASLLKYTVTRRHKVARVLIDAIEADDLHPNDAAVEVYLRRLIGLADKGLIEVFGNIRRPRYGEVALPEQDEPSPA